ncbi:hypothetical protein H8B13_15060 [Hymenobacter sp. BT188]|uniref:hypothetical protein n=1 Tax=Hymenobacter sp. BT188 TaxID=2763504 RepID=UPI0016510A33|nr:hypothetical protein [Hymenobacter sp. BT188]MBC6608145.1 hypothetical protein [Hymenobacter sp. BT188]
MRLFLPIPLILFSFAALLLGCEPKEEIVTRDSSARLEFSADTLLFDTIFVQTGTVTKRLWVYNRNRRAVQVEQIALKTANSPYTLTVSGASGPSTQDVEIRGRDSLLLLVKAKLGPGAENTPFLVEDQVQFRTNGNEQQVALVAYGQNAYFHTAETLACNTVWRNDKPHVIYDFVRVDAGCTLTIEAGARVYVHAGSGIVIKGRLLVNPDLAPSEELKPDDPRFVRFAGDRLEAAYREIPGQWRGIQFDATSQGNVVRYAEIKNAGFGLLVFNPENRQPRPNVLVENTIIKNISGASLNFASGSASFDGAGILSFSGDFTLRNCLLTNCGEFAVRGLQGGNFALNFCTIANYTRGFLRPNPSLAFSDVLTLANGQPGPSVLPRVSILNSIVWGDNTDELGFENVSRYANQITVRNSLLRTTAYQGASSATQPGFGGTGTDNIFNTNPKFYSSPDRPRGNRFDYRLDTLSPASNRPLLAPLLARDLLNKPRATTTPDLGAYERQNP